MIVLALIALAEHAMHIVINYREALNGKRTRKNEGRKARNSKVKV